MRVCLFSSVIPGNALKPGRWLNCRVASKCHRHILLPWKIQVYLNIMDIHHPLLSIFGSMYLNSHPSSIRHIIVCMDFKELFCYFGKIISNVSSRLNAKVDGVVSYHLQLATYLTHNIKQFSCKRNIKNYLGNCETITWCQTDFFDENGETWNCIIIYRHGT